MMRTFNDCYVIIVFNAATVYFSLYARPFKLFLLYFLIITLTSFMCCTYTNIYIACDCVMCIRALGIGVFKVVCVKQGPFFL